MDGAVDAIFPRPGDHFARGWPILDATEPDLTEEADPCDRKLLEIMLFHSRLYYRGSREHLYAASAKVRKAALRSDRHRLETDDVAGPARRVNFARGHHRRDSAMQA